MYQQKIKISILYHIKIISYNKYRIVVHNVTMILWALLSGLISHNSLNLRNGNRNNYNNKMKSFLVLERKQQPWKRTEKALNDDFHINLS